MTKRNTPGGRAHEEMHKSAHARRGAAMIGAGPIAEGKPSRLGPSVAGDQTPTRLPPSAPTSSLLPSIAMSPDPSQLLSQYSMLLQSGALQASSHAGAVMNPFLGAAAAASSASSAPSGSSAATATESSNLTGGPMPIANQLLSSLAQIVATQQATAQVAAAFQGPTSVFPTTATSAAPPQHHVRSVAAAQTQAGNNLILPTGLQNWTTGQLSKQANLLNQLQQPVPQSLSLLLTEAQRRHEKKEAKRVANRRSASVSRARKKALVQEMTELNARLKRQALILALLPDLVIAVDVDGVITFCSDQVERILRFKPDMLVGSKLTDLLVPSSREKLLRLFKELVGPEAKLDPSSADAENCKSAPHKGMKVVSEISDSQDPDDSKSAVASSSKGTAVPEVSDASFPLSIVNVDVDPASVATKQADDNENNYDTSASRDSKQTSSLTNSVSVPRSPTAESSGNSGSDDGGTTKKGKKATGNSLPSSDTSNTSSSMDQANANLERNVRWHNKKLKSLQSDEIGVFKDDVIGAAVTANNASARLSSLRVQPERPEGSSSEEDDSGYRESNESREESSSAASDLTVSNGRRKPLAPTCNVCLIRNDLTTLWCEVTSSIRTREPDEDFDDGFEVDSRKPPPSQPDASRASSVTNETEIEVLASKPEGKEGVKEILLCLRPIRDGDEKGDPTFRFGAREKGLEARISGTSTIASAQVDVSSSSDQGRLSPGAAKKRKMLESGVGEAYKRTRTESDVGMDAAIAESLVLMSSSKSA